MYTTNLKVVHQTYPILTGKIKMAKNLLFQIQITLVNYSVETTQSASHDSKSRDNSTTQFDSTHPAAPCASAPPFSSRTPSPSCSLSRPSRLRRSEALFVRRLLAVGPRARRRAAWRGAFLLEPAGALVCLMARLMRESRGSWPCGLRLECWLVW